MLLSASPNRRVWAAAFAFAGVLGALAGPVGAASGGDPSAQSETRPMAPAPDPFASRFADVVLRTHEGKTVRFYEDLLAGKIVVINFMYATCKGR